MAIAIDRRVETLELTYSGSEVTSPIIDMIDERLRGGSVADPSGGHPSTAS